MWSTSRSRWIAVLLVLSLLLLASCSAPASESSKQQTIVYITATGHKYHRDGCRYLSRSKIPVVLEKAIAHGYAPCSVCKPPR